MMSSAACQAGYVFLNIALFLSVLIYTPLKSIIMACDVINNPRPKAVFCVFSLLIYLSKYLSILLASNIHLLHNGFEVKNYLI